MPRLDDFATLGLQSIRHNGWEICPFDSGQYPFFKNAERPAREYSLGEAYLSDLYMIATLKRIVEALAAKKEVE